MAAKKNAETTSDSAEAMRVSVRVADGFSYTDPGGHRWRSGDVVQVPESIADRADFVRV